MKVRVQNFNKPLPFIGAAVQGATNLIGAGIQAGTNKKIQKMQMAHDKDMAALNQEYNLETMEKQNEYQVEQWNRENEYNDPSAVAARFRDAGVSPQAALGGSATGAGIAGGLSSAPSGSGSMGHSSTLQNTNAWTGLGEGLASSMRVDAQNKRDLAEATKANEEARSAELDNAEKEFMRDNGAWLAKVEKAKGDAETATAIASIKSYQASKYDYEHSLKMREKRLFGNKLLSDINRNVAEIERLSKLNELTDVEKSQLRSLKDKLESETYRLDAENKFYDRYGFYPGQKIETSLVSAMQHLPVQAKWLGSQLKRIFIDRYAPSPEVQQEIVDIINSAKDNLPELQSKLKKFLNDFAKSTGNSFVY